MEVNFFRGLMYGVVATMIIGYILGRMGKANSTFKQRNKPLDTFPDASQPKLTPAGIVRKSLFALFAWVFWLIILIAFVILVITAISLDRGYSGPILL